MRVSKTLDESSILSRPAELDLEVYMLKFIKETRSELRKVIWPTKDEVLSSTIVVLWVTIAISIFLFITDMMFDSLFKFVVNLGTGA